MTYEKSPEVQNPKKSYWKALFLLCFGGLFGAHHLYLGRIDHAILYMFTGGGLGLGLFYDLFFRLKFYVKWANFDHDPKFREEYKAQMKDQERPSNSMVRLCAVTFLPTYASRLVKMAIPKESLNLYVYQAISATVVPLVITCMVWFVGSVGHVQGNLRRTFKNIYFFIPFIYLDASDLAENIWCVVAVYNFQKSSTFRGRPKKRRSVSMNILYIGMFMVIFYILLGSYLINNCQITEDESGEVVQCTDVIKEFFKLPVLTQFLESLQTVMRTIREQGLHEGFRTMVVLTDFTGKERARQILNVTSQANWDDIRRSYRKLSKIYHPDKNLLAIEEEKKRAEEKLLEVQRAYQILKENFVGDDIEKDEL